MSRKTQSLKLKGKAKGKVRKKEVRLSNEVSLKLMFVRHHM